MKSGVTVGRDRHLKHIAHVGKEQLAGCESEVKPPLGRTQGGRGGFVRGDSFLESIEDGQSGYMALAQNCACAVLTKGLEMPKYKVPANKLRAWQQKCIDKKHATRANDTRMQARIDAQAIWLLVERMEQFGADWETGCAIRVPVEAREVIEAFGWQWWLEANKQKDIDQ